MEEIKRFNSELLKSKDEQIKLMEKIAKYKTKPENLLRLCFI